MLNQYPLWKNLLILTILLFAGLYAAPNFYGEDPSVQISPQRSSKIDQSTLLQVEKLLTDSALKAKKVEMTEDRILVRFDDTEAQLKAFRAGERANDPNSMMRTIAVRMTDPEIKAVADYIAGLR